MNDLDKLRVMSAPEIRVTIRQRFTRKMLDSMSVTASHVDDRGLIVYTAITTIPRDELLEVDVDQLPAYSTVVVGFKAEGNVR